MINVLWHYSDGFWDMALPRYILDTASTCQHFIGIDHTKGLDREIAVIVIPGQHSTKDYDALTAAAANFRRVVFIITGDEDATFDAKMLDHRRSITWWFAPPFKSKQEIDRVGPFGWPGGALEMIAKAREEKPQRIYDVNFAGQLTHQRRHDCFEAANKLKMQKFLYPTNGFSQGIPREDYYRMMLHSRYVLCPSGPCMPDSFRFAEALECGCVPIVDALAPNPEYPEGYWQYLFGDDLPFPQMFDWSSLEEVIGRLEPGYEILWRRCQSWWQSQKERWVRQMREDAWTVPF